MRQTVPGDRLGGCPRDASEVSGIGRRPRGNVPVFHDPPVPIFESCHLELHGLICGKTVNRDPDTVVRVNEWIVRRDSDGLACDRPMKVDTGNRI